MINELLLLVSLSKRQVCVHSTVVTEPLVCFPVAVGKRGWETPRGRYRIYDKLVNPRWTNFRTGAVMPAGPSNPMGSRWIGFVKDSRGEVGFHETKEITSIGRAASHGCLRMTRKDVQKLYDYVDIGTEVIVKN